MPVWPKSFYTCGLSLKSAATEWKLRQKRSGPATQARILSRLTPRFAAASYWREAGVEASMPYARFRARVPLQDYGRLAPAIEMMKGGASDVLWRGRCALFALTDGSETGAPKHIPMTGEILGHFRAAGLQSLLYYTVRMKHAGVFRGRHLLVGGASALVPVTTNGSSEAYAGELSGIVVLNLPAWAERYLYEPGSSAAKLADWQPRLEASATRAATSDITVLAALPTSALLIGHELRRIAASGTPAAANLQSLWPNFECFVHAGVPISPFADELRALLGPAVNFHEVYVATEGFIAAQDNDSPAGGLRLMADGGIFFEFLPMSEYDEARLHQLGPKAVPLSEVKIAVEYALVMTTPGGLARYVVGDVVRFTSLEPPRLLFTGRTRLRLNICGEQLMDRDATDALVALCQRRNWTVVNFHVSPRFTAANLTGQSRAQHEWWIELKPGTVATPTGPQIAAELDLEIQRRNAAYAARRKAGSLDNPVVRLVMPGVFEHWLRFRHRWGGQHKLPRCRNDREIADELAQITNFARD